MAEPLRRTKVTAPAPRSRTVRACHRLAAVEHRLALFDKGPRRLLVILGLGTTHMMGRFQIKAVIQVSAKGTIEVFFHVAVGDGGPGGEPAGDPPRLFCQRVSLADPVDEPEPERFLRIDALGKIIELPRLGGSDEFAEKIGATVIA